MTRPRSAAIAAPISARLPGNILQGIRRAGSRQCVMMLDEIDKLGRSNQGDPASALLEVLDPEQNSTFRDNYLGVPFDLSRVMFITHRQRARHHPRAAAGPHGGHRPAGLHRGREVRDRAPLSGRPAADRQRAQARAGRAHRRGDPRDHPRLHARSRRAQPRTRDRHGVAQRRDEDRRGQRRRTSRSTPRTCTRSSGARRFEGEVAMRTSIPGVATGLAWTPVGGDILFIEATRIPGKGGLILTGQLGEVMRESAQAALSLVKGRRARARDRPDSCSRRATSTSTCRPARSLRTAPRPASRCSPRSSRC